MEAKGIYTNDFTIEGLKIALQLYKDYLQYVVYVCLAKKKLKKFSAVEYCYYMVKSLDFNINSISKAFLVQQFKLNFLIFCLCIECKSKDFFKKTNWDDFGMCVKFFLFYMSFESQKHNHVMNSIIKLLNILAQILETNGNKKIHNLVIEWIEIYLVSIKSNKTPKINDLQLKNSEITEFENDETLQYFLKGIQELFVDERMFFTDNSYRKEFIKELDLF